jgi:putative transposase
MLETIVREAAQQMLAVALRSEAEEYLERHRGIVGLDGLRQVVGNGVSRARTVHTSIGTMVVRQPRVDDRRPGESFESVILPPYVRRTMEIEQLVPVLYLHGVSTGRMLEVLKSIAGDRFDSMSPATVTRIIESWQHEHNQWSKRRITKRYVYMWADGIYTKVRTTDDRPCMLVLIGCDEHGNKDLLAIYDGERESELSWTVALTDLKNRGLQAPRLAIGDGALGFWCAINKVYPKTAHQGCTIHALRNVLDKLPKKLFDEAKSMVQDIFLAPTLKDAKDAFNVFAAAVRPKYPKAVETLERRLDMLLSYYRFPAEHWKSIRSTNVIESTFATIRRRTSQTNGHASREAALAMVFAMGMQASKTWRRIDGFNLILHVINGAQCIDGELKLAA